ncbi:hypothetical protein [Muricoccus vinaceus]|uniref:Uncharacterized protein n=1 Tax=Muricoccus vinaceus TaxID=424704 RepID=A0ABV6IL79_9PROT
MVLRLTSPTLRGEVISGPDAGSVSFGSAENWLRSHSAMDTVCAAIAAAVNGRPSRFSDRRGSVWRLDLYAPGKPVAPLPKTSPPQDRSNYEAVRRAAMGMPGLPFASHAAIKAAADAVEGRRA